MKTKDILQFLEDQENIITTLELSILKEETKSEEINFTKKFLKTNLAALSLNIEKSLCEQNSNNIHFDTKSSIDKDRIEKTLKEIISKENPLYNFTNLSEIRTKQQQILDFPYQNLNEEDKHQIELKTLSIISDRFF